MDESGQVGRVIREMAEQGGRLGIEVVDIAAHVDRVSRRVAEQATMFRDLRGAARDVVGSNDAVARAAHDVQAVSRDATREIAASRGQVDGALEDIRALAAAATAIEERLGGLRDALEAVAKVARGIGGIARQTNLLAVNASVEAAHAGALGAGFAVIAQAVKTLAEQTKQAAAQVDETLKRLTEQAGQLLEQSAKSTGLAEQARGGTNRIGTVIETACTSMATIDAHVGEIVQATGVIGGRMDAFIDSVGEFDDGVQESSRDLADASVRLNGLQGMAEGIIMLTASTDVATVDAPFIALAQGAAARIAAAYEEALAAGSLSVDDVFDTRYVPVPGTDPQQYTTRGVPFADRVVQPLIDDVLARDTRVTFCVHADVNGYLATHNRRYSETMGADVAWNTAHCRNRRIFDDRVGLKAARNTQPFLIQTYRRDLGNGEFRMMKDVSVPVWIAGRHQGGLRIGYTF